LLFVQIAAANLVVNGDFETNDLTGWTLVPASEGSLFNIVQYYGHSGDYAAGFGASAAYDDTITQDIPTVDKQQYTFDFWLRHLEIAEVANDFHVFWNGTELLSLVNHESFDYTHYVYTVTATGSSSTIRFAGFENDDTSFYLVDDVSVSQVPLPGAVVLLGSGLLPLLGWRRMRKG
ncbi:MAG: hypothetical protein NTW80_11540, partial [Deltaproteobacteria bacterium]|nr:hypothetical protein [Deltaproteobacteria bacterium]